MTFWENKGGNEQEDIVYLFNTVILINYEKGSLVINNVIVVIFI